MDNKESPIAARRSWNLLLFLIPQVARNLLEALNTARSAVWDDATAAEQALFAQQEALLGKFCTAIEPMSRGVWDLTEERLSRLVNECEELRTKLDREGKELALQEFRNRLDGSVPAPEDAKAKAKRLAHVLAGGQTSKPEPTSPGVEG